MTYRDDEEARKEASDYRASGEAVDRLKKQCEQKAAALGAAGVRDHKVGFNFASWNQSSGLPDSIPRSGSISRGEVLDIGQRVRESRTNATELLFACFAWGWGQAGYGPRRLRDICEAAGDRLESSLMRAVEAANPDTGPADPVSGYELLYGGHDHTDRQAAGTAPWARLYKFGPAFFTKFLYFSTPGALILDNRLARAVHDLSGLPHLIDGKRRSEAWTPYRYAVYLRWMKQTAEAAGTEPDMLELTLFEPPADLEDEGDAAD